MLKEPKTYFFDISMIRLIDCAPRYENQESIGQAINEAINTEKVKRHELFIISKLYHTCHRPEHVIPAIRATLKELNLDYLG